MLFKVYRNGDADEWTTTFAHSPAYNEPVLDADGAPMIMCEEFDTEQIAALADMTPGREYAYMYQMGFFEGQQDPRRTCPVHEGQVHGGEAEELRSGIEKVLEGLRGEDPDWGTDTVEQVAQRLERLLDGTDARDSLAHLEAKGPYRFAHRERQR